MQFKAQDGQLCVGDPANAEVLRWHFDDVHNRKTGVDPSVLQLLRQRDEMPELAVEPSSAEVAAHLRKAKKGKSPGESGLAVECFQALADNAETLALVHDTIIDCWRADGVL
jgi:hypothetical protein